VKSIAIRPYRFSLSEGSNPFTPVFCFSYLVTLFPFYLFLPYFAFWSWFIALFVSCSFLFSF
jgi:hypothetical protein